MNTTSYKAFEEISVQFWSTFGDKDELITFSGQKVKVQGHDETKYGLKRHRGNFESHVM